MHPRAVQNAAGRQFVQRVLGRAVLPEGGQQDQRGFVQRWDVFGCGGGELHGADGRISRDEFLAWYLQVGFTYLTRPRFECMQLAVPTMAEPEQPQISTVVPSCRRTVACRRSDQPAPAPSSW